MFSCRLGRLRAGDADEVRQHAPRVGALCVAEADGVGHRVRHAQHLQSAVRLRCQQPPRQILGAEAGAHAARQNAAEDDHYDEHVWLSLKNAIVCTETLADAITELDSDNAKQYVTNAKTYTGKLEALDDDYQTMRDAATQTTILVGDRFPFLYLAEDYDIHYFAAYSGCSADVEASVHTVTYLAEKLQEYKLQAIYVVDNGTDSLANTIAESAEMQPKILHLSSMQSVTKDDIEKGCTYLSYMEENLQMLKQGLQAP